MSDLTNQKDIGKYCYNTVQDIISKGGERFSPNNIKAIYLSSEGVGVLYHKTSGRRGVFVQFEPSMYVACINSPYYTPIIRVLIDKVCSCLEEICFFNPTGYPLVHNSELDLSSISIGGNVTVTDALLRRFTRLRSVGTYSCHVRDALSTLDKTISEKVTPFSTYLFRETQLGNSCLIADIQVKNEKFYRHYFLRPTYYKIDGVYLDAYFKDIETALTRETRLSSTSKDSSSDTSTQKSNKSDLPVLFNYLNSFLDILNKKGVLSLSFNTGSKPIPCDCISPKTLRSILEILGDFKGYDSYNRILFNLVASLNKLGTPPSYRPYKYSKSDDIIALASEFSFRHINFISERLLDEILHLSKNGDLSLDNFKSASSASASFYVTSLRLDSFFKNLGYTCAYKKLSTIGTAPVVILSDILLSASEPEDSTTDSNSEDSVIYEGIKTLISKSATDITQDSCLPISLGDMSILSSCSSASISKLLGTWFSSLAKSNIQYKLLIQSIDNTLLPISVTKDFYAGLKSIKFINLDFHSAILSDNATALDDLLYVLIFVHQLSHPSALRLTKEFLNEYIKDYFSVLYEHLN